MMKARRLRLRFAFKGLRANARQAPRSHEGISFMHIELTKPELQALKTPIVVARQNALVELNKALDHRNGRVITMIINRMSALDKLETAFAEELAE